MLRYVLERALEVNEYRASREDVYDTFPVTVSLPERNIFGIEQGWFISTYIEYIEKTYDVDEEDLARISYWFTSNKPKHIRFRRVFFIEIFGTLHEVMYSGYYQNRSNASYYYTYVFKRDEVYAQYGLLPFYDLHLGKQAGSHELLDALYKYSIGMKEEAFATKCTAFWRRVGKAPFYPSFKEYEGQVYA
ncbi:hypothetical protein ACXWTF_12580 [Thiomicrolovo sp. ZZH C-3]